MATKIPGFRIKVDKTGKQTVEPDFAAREAKLDVSTRLQRRNSKRVKVVRKGK